jgi:LysM repeat protein
MRNTPLGSVNRKRYGILLTAVLLLSLLAPMTALAAPAQSNLSNNTEWVQVYTVERGDTLSGIAWSFGLSEAALMKANSLRNSNLIYVGQQLIIPTPEKQGTGGPECAVYYTVVRGDSLSSVALTYGIDEYTLARANGIYELNEIYVGQKLCVPTRSGGTPQQPPATNEGPQRPADVPQRPSEPPKNEGPKNEGPKADGPVRPDNGPQAEGPKNEGPKNDGPKAEGPNTEGPVRPGDGPQRPEDKPRDSEPDRPEPLRPTEYWKGTYFSDKYFSEFALERQDLEVNFNWFTGSPFNSGTQDRFSVRWEKVEYFKGGPYRFYAIADDGVRVYVDDQLIIDAWVIQPATEYKADLDLSDGPHKIVVEYYEEAEDAQIRVYWEQRRPTK